MQPFAVFDYASGRYADMFVSTIDAMPKLRIATYIERGSLVVRLNDVEIINGGGKYEAEIPPGVHVLQWYVTGAPGSSYSISVASPVDAEYQLTRKVKKTGKDFGGFGFEDK